MNDSFVFYKSWWDAIEEVHDGDDKTKQDLYIAIIKYGITGVKTFPCEKMFLMQTYAQIDAAKKKHSDRVNAGRVGGSSGLGASKARQGNKNASKRKQTQANDNVNGNVNENANDNVNVNDNIVVMPLETTSLDGGGSTADKDIEWGDP